MPKLASSVGRVLAIDQLADGDFLVVNRDTGRWATVNAPALDALRQSELGDESGTAARDVPGLRKLLDTSQPREIPGPAGLPRYIIYKLTHACNFSCFYCYDKRLVRRTDRVRRAAAFREIVSLALSDPQSRVFVLFHGGEPLLELEEIQRLVAEHRRDFPGRVHFSIQTNGSLLNNDVLSFAAENNVGLSVSVDGVTPEDNRLRVSRRHSDPYRALCKLLGADAALGRDELGLHLTVGPHNFRRMADILPRIENDGFRSISFNLLDTSDGPDGNGCWDPAAAALEMVRLVDMANAGQIHDLALQYLIQWTLRLLGQGPELACISSPCGAGRGVVAVYPSGEIAPCDSLFTPELLYTSVSDYVRATKREGKMMELLVRRVDNQERCSGCDVKTFCNGTCPGSAQASVGDLQGTDPFECQFNFVLIRELLRRLAQPIYRPYLNYCSRHIAARNEMMTRSLREK